MISFFVTLALVAVLVDAIVLITWKTPRQPTEPNPLPTISILIPLRNEAHNIAGLIECLKKLEYPAEKMEFILGEDRSTDNSLHLLKSAVAGDSRFRIVSINSDTAGLKAKANVINQLIPLSNSSFYFITDADVRVSPGWVTSMLAHLKENDGAIGGPTVVRVSSLWSGLQNLDWMMAQGLLYVVSRWYQTLAISGTNMMITSHACNLIGGYDKIPYSLTEDIGVLTAIKRKGLTATNVLNHKAMALIEAQPDWQTLTSQRARWTYGAFKLPWGIVLLLLVRSLFLISILTILWSYPDIGLAMIAFKSLIDLLLLKKVAEVLKQKISFWHFMCFECYTFVISMAGLLRYILFRGVTWKGRVIYD